MRLDLMLERCLLGLTCLPLFSATVTIVPVDAFGKATTGCQVTEFIERALDSSQPLTNPHDFHRNFDGLRAVGIDEGPFDLTVRCDNRYRGHATIWIRRADFLVVVHTSNRIGDDHFGGKPRLTLTIDSAPPNSWVRAINPYAGMSETAPIDPATGVANLYDIATGKYVIFLLTPGRIAGKYEIDHAQQGETIKLNPNSTQP